MSKLNIGVFAVLASLLLSGCFTVDVASSPVLGDDVERHVTVKNYGWYLFGCIPLACGNERLDSWCPFSMLCDEVRLPIAYAKLTDIARKEGCRIADLHVYDDNDVLFEAYYVTIPWVIVCKDVCLSANLVREGREL